MYMLQILVVVGLIAAAWYLLIVRPQRAQHGRHERTLGQISIGTNVMTVGGIFGCVHAIEGETIVLELAPGMFTRVASDGIARIVAPGQMPLPQPAPSPAAGDVQQVAAPQSAPHIAHEAPNMYEQHPNQPQPQPQYAPEAQPAMYQQPAQQMQPQPHPHPQYVAPTPQMVSAHGQPHMQPQQAADYTVRAEVAPSAAGFQPRQFTAFQLPPPPVFGHAQAAPMQQPAQGAPVQGVPPVQYSVQPYAPQQQSFAQPQQYVQVPVQQYVPQPVQQYVPVQQQLAAPQQAFQQQPVHAQQMGAPVVPADAAAMPIVDDVTVAAPVRQHSTAPHGMGATLRLDDPTLRDTIDRARRERGELADEYRRLNEPLVAMAEQAAAQAAAAPQHAPAAVQQHPQQLFVQQAPAGGAVAQPMQQFPVPAQPPQAHAYGTPGIVDPSQAGTIPAPGAFARQTPYSPAMQHAEVAPASA